VICTSDQAGIGYMHVSGFNETEHEVADALDQMGD